MDGWVDVHPGDVIGGAYRVERVLDRGHGLSVSACHTQFDKRVVIRLLPVSGDRRQQTRLRREARLLAKLQSEHAARILDVGTHTDGSLYLVREHVGGRTLAEELDARGALSLDRALLFTLQMCTLVQEAHQLGVILRELGPRQVNISSSRGGDERVKLVDLGAVKRFDAGEATATLGVGISPYTAPELFRSNDVDGRVDVWALGCLLYEMLTARAPFEGEGAQLLDAIARRDPLAVSQIRGDLPEAIDKVVGWALAKQPDDRFTSPYAFAHTLRSHASAEGQVLIDRIARIAHERPKRQPVDEISGVTRMWTGPAAPPSRPSSRGSGPPPPPSRASRRGSHPGERPSSAPPPSRSSQPCMPPPPMSSPGGGYASVPPPPMSSPGSGGYAPVSSLAAVSMAQRGSGAWEARTSSAPPPAQSGAYAAAQASVPPPGGMPMRPFSLGALVLLIAVLPTVALAVLLGRPEATLAADDGIAPAVGPHVVEAMARPVAAPPAATETEKKVVAAPAAPPATPMRATGPRPSFFRPAAPAEVDLPEEVTPPPSEESGPGTVVAVVLGGKCALSLDGASRGFKSSFTASVPAGSHSVTCSPKGKAPRSRRLTVEPGKKAVAMFKL
jgi:serine/threonine-protein kinase